MKNDFSNPLTLFESLSDLSLEDDDTTFVARPLPGRNTDFLAKGKDNQPVILFCIDPKTFRNLSAPIRLEHLSVDHGLECKIQLTNGTTLKNVFSALRCVEADKALQEYFLRSIIPVAQSLPASPSNNEISKLITALADLFRRISDPGKKTIQGLWGELFVVALSTMKKQIIDSWHASPYDRYDFNQGSERLEVKSSSKRERIHHFSFEQLHPPHEVDLLIASIFVVESGNGKSIFDLMDQIKNQIEFDFYYVERIDQVVSNTLGSTWRQAMEIKFDYEEALSSLRYFNFSDVPTIQSPLPDGVASVRFQSNLEYSTYINLGELPEKGALFSSLGN